MRAGAVFPILLVSLVIASFSSLWGSDFSAGRIRLTLHEDTGRFSLYYLSNVSEQLWEPLFAERDPRTSFLAVNLNDRVYRLGESSVFTVRTDPDAGYPVLIFESPFMLVREEFSFIRTMGSRVSNGVRITVRLTNKTRRQSTIGLRFLLDTDLGEGPGKIPFILGKEIIIAERIIEGGSGEKNWVSGSDTVSLMGSIADIPAGASLPSFVHFANWKRLNDDTWKTAYSRGRSFNFSPYSIRDSAVCYYYEPAVFSPGESVDYSILLAANDPAGFRGIDSPSGKDADMQTLRELLARLDRYMAGELIISEEELNAISRQIARFKARYGSGTP